MESRVSRVGWWFWFFGFQIAGANVLRLAAGFILPGNEQGAGPALSQIIAWAVLNAIVLAVVLRVQMTATIGRAHDRDDSWWPFWIYALAKVTFAGYDFFMWALPVEPIFHPLWASGPVLTATAWLVIKFGLRSGDPKANRWGPVPKPLFGFSSPGIDNYRPPKV